MKRKLCFLLSACALAGSSAYASLVVQNGDFSSMSGPNAPDYGAADSWTVLPQSGGIATDIQGYGVGGTVNTAGGFLEAGSGANGEVFSAPVGSGSSYVESHSTIQQDILLNNSAGKSITYEVSFYAMNLITSQSTFTTQNKQDFLINFDMGMPDNQKLTLPVANGTTTAAYQQYNLFFTTTDPNKASLDIEWVPSGPNMGVVGLGLIDDVTVKAVSPVPEPSTLIAGLLVLLPSGASTLKILRKKLNT